MLNLRGLAWLVVLTLTWVSTAQADMGPKASLGIRVTYDGGAVPGGVTYFSLLMLNDGSNEKSPAQPAPQPGTLPRAAPTDEAAVEARAEQRVDLLLQQDSSCSRPFFASWGGGYSRTSQTTFGNLIPRNCRVAVFVPALDRLFVTPPFDREGYHTSCTIDLRPDGTAVVTSNVAIETPVTAPATFLMALFIVCCVELCTASIVFFPTKSKLPAGEGPWRRTLAVLIVNAVTMPLVWRFQPRITTALSLSGLSTEGLMLGLEILAEGLGLYLLCRPFVGRFEALRAAFYINVTSAFVGNFILLFLYLR